MMDHYLVLGQSNVASHGSGDLIATAHGRVWHDGTLSGLADPVPGGTGTAASIWPRFVDRLFMSSGSDGAVISMRAVGGSGSDEWGAGGRHFDALMRDATSIKACPVPITHIVFHQGERDTLLKTTAQVYFERIATLVDAVRQQWGDASWIVCRASYRMGVVSEDVIAAQDRLIAHYNFCHAGPNTDALGADYRHDNTHFNERGLDAFSGQLVATVEAMRPRDPLKAGTGQSIPPP